MRGFKNMPKKYTGEGKKLDDAIRNAVKLAEKDIKYADGAIKWKVIDIFGEVGGFFSFKYKVTIEVIPFQQLKSMDMKKRESGLGVVRWHGYGFRKGLV